MRDRVSLLRSAAAPLAACLVLGLLVACVRLRGFVGISHDDAARALIAWDFSRAPSVDPTRSSWLPAHTWTLGALLSAWRDLTRAPAALSLASACAAVALTHRSARALGASQGASLVALTLVVAWRWSVLSAAAGAVPEMPCVAWFLGGLALLAAGREALAGLCLTLACGHRYEAWFATAALVAWELYATRGRAWRLALAAALFPVAWLCINYARVGDCWDFIHRVEAFRRAEGPLPSLAARASRYPSLLARELAPIALLALLALRSLWHTTHRRDALRLALPAGATFAMLVVGDLRGGGPTHHPARALLLVAWILAPLAAHGLTLRAPRALLVALAALGVASSLPRRDDWRDGVSPDAVCAGDAVARALRRRPADERWWVEAAREDFLWVELRSGAPDRALPDRPYGASRPSSLPPELQACRVAATSSRDFAQVLRSKGFHVDSRCGAWEVWTLPSSSEASSSGMP